MLFYEQGVGLKSSITADTAFRKDLTLQGCTNCPSKASHVRPVSTWLGKRMKLRNVRVPLTSNAQFRVAPGESTSNPKAGQALESASSVWLRSGLVSPIDQGTSLAHQCGPTRGTMSPLVRVVSKTAGVPTKHTHVCK